MCCFIAIVGGLKHAFTQVINVNVLMVVCCVSAQRSAVEKPTVDHQDSEHCSVLGGLQMVLRGQNFTSETRVVFYEKTHGEEI